MTTPDILIIEDTASIALVFQKWLKKSGINAVIAGTGSEGIEHLRTGMFKAVLLDLDLPDMKGQDIVKLAKDEGLDITFVIVTASGSINVAVDAMRMGAYDFLIKPAAEERLVTTVRNALEREAIQSTVKEIKKVSNKKSKHGFTGSSLPMIAVYRMIDSIAQSKASVFITGESGTGKEVCAQSIHDASPRKNSAFVPLNCAAIPKDLIESEIFGHKSGAFTGATSDRTGAAITADGGTLFLDEICEMDLNLQSKLLRFLQTGIVQKVGSDQQTRVDVRILCATNRDPMLEVAEGRFREDLYYRLHVLPLHLPALRDREGDAVEIAKVFLAEMSLEEGKSFKGFAEDAENALLNYQWPGNIRELQNTIRKVVILNDVEYVTADMLQIDHSANLKLMTGNKGNDFGEDGLPFSINLNQNFADIERQVIEAAILHCNNSIPKASEMLQLSPSTIYRKKEGWE
jgi:DNA-binding NtrC family response regulator